MNTTAVVVILVALIGLAGVAAIGWPLFGVHGASGDPTASDGAAVDIELHDDLERALRAIRELEFEHRAGNLSDADYAELDRIERARAAELLRRRDEAT